MSVKGKRISTFTDNQPGMILLDFHFKERFATINKTNIIRQCIYRFPGHTGHNGNKITTII